MIRDRQRMKIDNWSGERTGRVRLMESKKSEH